MRKNRPFRVPHSTRLLLLAAAVVSPLPAQAPGADNLQILPQVFHLDDSNRTVIYVQNVTGRQISVGLEFFTQEGVLACAGGHGCPVADFDLAPFGTLVFDELPRPFVGTATVFCDSPCVSTASWKFDVAEGDQFEVGVLPHLFTRRSSTWGSPIPPVPLESSYGFAIYNLSGEEMSCLAHFLDPGGQESSQEQYVIPVNGQIAVFAGDIDPGFAGSTLLDCDREALATAIIQSLRTGFPTSLNYAPLPGLNP